MLKALRELLNTLSPASSVPIYRGFAIVGKQIGEWQIRKDIYWMPRAKLGKTIEIIQMHLMFSMPRADKHKTPAVRYDLFLTHTNKCSRYLMMLLVMATSKETSDSQDNFFFLC
ncbi:hypothetical protein P308_28990 [Pseudomonas piscis]|nr:hypothetical protein P308_28990 [Pseudomonas piscis]